MAEATQIEEDSRWWQEYKSRTAFYMRGEIIKDKEAYTPDETAHMAYAYYEFMHRLDYLRCQSDSKKARRFHAFHLQKAIHRYKKSVPPKMREMLMPKTENLSDLEKECREIRNAET